LEVSLESERMNKDNVFELLEKVLKELHEKNDEPQIQYFTISEVAEKLKVSKPTVRSWIKNKKYPLPHFNFGKRQIRIYTDDLEEWIINHRKKVQERAEKLIQISK
jgi:excisionase family DNA binding protein